MTSTTVQFETRLRRDHTLTVPAEVAARLPLERPVRVIVIVAESDDDPWPELTAEEFLSGYADSDAIYDRLSAG